jgi:hypothetical protein
MSTRSEALGPGIAWNATRAASVLLVVIVAVIALVFWPSLKVSDRGPASTRQVNVPAAPHQPIVVNGEVCVQCSP